MHVAPGGGGSEPAADEGEQVDARADADRQPDDAGDERHPDHADPPALLRFVRERIVAMAKEHIALFHDSYRRLTSEFIAQSQLIDGAVSRFVGVKAAEIQPFKTEPGTRSEG